VPALPPSILEPLWDHFAALLPHRDDTHPLGCHRPRIPDRVIFDKLIQILVFGCGYRRIADHTCLNRPGMRGDSIAWKGRWSHGRDHQPQASRAEALPA
jgi:hypothetical protein